ncbi:cystatin-M [Fukomys damarensis]|uniref:Cystatin-M n=1 Tax=Fukomys damarensis TaxID=885580 RepID=A0A091DD14_FUKDA|nr:cystatin-M [Fukomys damarensis]KFO28383.1 Cystatin-M [Fukomys damarensis]
MARQQLTLAMGLSLLAICLLALSPDARAQPRDRRTGERKNLSINDPQVQRMAQTAVTTFNSGSNSAYYFRDTNIIKAERQLVAGVKYYLTMDLESTACRKTRVSGDHMDLTTCPLATGVEQEKLRCDFEILEVPWKNSTELLKHKCMQQ